MAVRTVVTMRVSSDVLVEGRQALDTLISGPFGARVEVIRPGSDDADTVLIARLPGDVADDVRERLGAATSLPFDVAVEGA